MILNRIPGGLRGLTTEFYTDIVNNMPVSNVIYAGHHFSFAEAPKSRKDILKKRLKELPEADKAYEAMVGNNIENKIEKMSMCMYGALNQDPDIDENDVLSDAEYVPCNERGTCVHEGKGCLNILVAEGVFLSKQETEVFKLVKLSNAEIADTLFISEFTVKKHFQNITRKTG